jgi:hypothetical protein
MNHKCAHFWGAISLLSLLLTIQAQAGPDPCNGRFEFFDPNSDFNTPTDWQHANYTAVVNHFIPHPVPRQGETTNWKIDPEVGLSPFEGDYFLVLSNGDMPGEPSYAKVWQTIAVEAGNKLTGAYFFGTCDYLPYNDFADIRLIPLPDDSNLSEISIVYISVEDVCNYGSLSGWTRFEKTFTADEAGTYDLIIRVSDYGEDIYWDSYFAVDGLVLCRYPSGVGDFTCDCTVNFQDFTLFAADWLRDCSDPLVYNDPNTNCRLGTNLSGSSPVDIDDLWIMSEHWLEGTKE